MEYTREQLIEICEKSFVPQEKWDDRDSCSTQQKLGSCYALLKAGCHFEIMTAKTEGGDKSCTTDYETIWVRLFGHTFSWFELVEDEDEKGHEIDYYYLPTLKRLEEAKGEDWY